MLWQHVMRDVVRLHGAIDPTPISPAVELEQPAAPPGKPAPRPRKQPRRAKALPEVDFALFVPPAKPVV
ncbi:MAG: hypothetical protein ABF771_11415, partial [Acetobacter orientalis]